MRRNLEVSGLDADARSAILAYLGAVSLTLKVLHFEGCKALVEKAFYEAAIV